VVATYSLLFLAFVALYLPAVPLPGGYRLPPWQVVFAAALASGAFQRLLDLPALLAIAALWLCAELRHRSTSDRYRPLLLGLVIALAIALALHLVPGFPNPVVAQDVRLSAASAEMTLKANFDKGAAGLLLLAYLSPRPVAREWPRLLATGVSAGAVTAVAAIGIVAAVGAVRLDPKWPELALAWIPINLLLTCVFEEMLFRGLLQRGLQERLRANARLRHVPIALASLLFGMVHAGGGLLLIVAATVAGVGYGVAYDRSKRIEAAVLAHFTLNAAHFFLFTYPYAAR
jgi:membrane protease YdiL (CAAX protease family)